MKGFPVVASLDHSPPCSRETGPDREARLALKPWEGRIVAIWQGARELRGISVGSCTAQPEILCLGCFRRALGAVTRTCLCSIGKEKTENRIPV